MRGHKAIRHLIFLAWPAAVLSTWQINTKTNKTFLGWEQIDQVDLEWCLAVTIPHYLHVCATSACVRCILEIYISLSSVFFPPPPFLTPSIHSLPSFLLLIPQLHLPFCLFPTLPLCNFFSAQLLHILTPYRCCYQRPDIVLWVSSSSGLHKDHQLTFLTLLLPPPPSPPPFSRGPFVPIRLFCFTVWPTFLCSASHHDRSNYSLITGCVLMSWYRANPFHHFSTFFSPLLVPFLYYPPPVLSLTSPHPISPIAQPSKKYTKSLLLSLCWSIENETTVPFS